MFVTILTCIKFMSYVTIFYSILFVLFIILTIPLSHLFPIFVIYYFIHKEDFHCPIYIYYSHYHFLH